MIIYDSTDYNYYQFVITDRVCLINTPTIPAAENQQLQTIKSLRIEITRV